MFKVGTEKPHATMMVFPSAALARTATATHRRGYKSLTGPWKFHLSPRPADRPADFFAPGFDDGAWKTSRCRPTGRCRATICPSTPTSSIPGRRTRGSRRTCPTDKNPVGSYRTPFTVPADWNGRHVFLHFAGVDSAFYVWVNGTKVGYSEDSRTPAEFDITPHLKAGENLLAVEVYRLQRRRLPRRPGHVAHVAASSATSSSGPPRPQHVRDFEVKTALDADYKDATLSRHGRGGQLREGRGAGHGRPPRWICSDRRHRVVPAHGVKVDGGP